jgi:hypothetical protein
MSKLELLEMEDEDHPVEIEAGNNTANEEADNVEAPESKKQKMFPADTHSIAELTSQTKK